VSDLPASAHSAFAYLVYRVVRKSADWYKRSKFNDRYDIGLCAYTSLMRIVAKFHEELFSDPDTATGLNKVTRDSWG